ncbi:hypothetical protein [Ohtaekwangia sp.]|jgi:hypothetical protein|uniref:hypothetical protein n=1 Tax=Ohtaekwangia sp. TaxID=2066019 RepID=UPI002F92458A
MSGHVMSINQIELYNLLKSRLGDREAKALVQFVSESVSEKMEAQRIDLATREDVKGIELAMKGLEVKIEAGFKDQLKWLIVLMMGFSSLILALVKFLPLINS